MLRKNNRVKIVLDRGGDFRYNGLMVRNKSLSYREAHFQPALTGKNIQGEPPDLSRVHPELTGKRV
jgi:hypothetical protein